MANKPILHIGPKHSEVRRLLGDSYTYTCENNSPEHIAEIIEKAYISWKDQKEFKLNRSDLEIYVSKQFLNQQFKKHIIPFLK